ncbi:hypothetical protein ACVBGC_25985 [Burkholderia stagnalis]
MSFEFGGTAFRAVAVAFGMMLAACGRHDTPVAYSPVAQFTSASVPPASLPPDADAQLRAGADNVLRGLKENAQGQQTKRDVRVTAFEQNTFLTVVRSPDDMHGFELANFGASPMPPDVNPGPDDVLLVISHQSDPDHGYEDTVETVPDAPADNGALTLRITSTEVRTPGIVAGVGYFNNNVFVVKRGKASKLILSFDDAQQAYDLGPVAR